MAAPVSEEDILETSEEMETADVNPNPDAVEADVEDDSDVDENDEAIKDLTQKVSSNPYQYDLHIQLITLLKTAGEFEKLRKAREDMSAIFPLTEELWLEWIKDEIKFIEDEDKSREDIEALFERAIKDYLAVNVWLEYAQFSIGGHHLHGGKEKTRDVCERAITAVGLHVAKGNSIWEIYREFENAILMTMQTPPGVVPTNEEEVDVQAQLERMENIFKRQLRIPLLDMDATKAEYEDWMGEPAAQDVWINYKSALAKMKKYQTYEEALITSEGTNLMEWQLYLEFISKEGDPATVRCCFERAVEEHCLNTDLWVDFTQYIESHSKIAELQLCVYNRAVRNCPWSPTLWKGYMRTLELYEQPHLTVKETFEKSLLGGFTKPEDFLGLWESYIDYMRRRLDKMNETSLETDSDSTEAKDELRATIEKAVEYLELYFSSTTADPAFRLQRYQALVEAKYFQNMEKARELWNTIIGAGHATKAHMWMEYYQQERLYGDSKHCRKILHRAVNAVNDWPEQVCKTLIMFERLEGTLETLLSARKRVDTQMKRVEERREKEWAEADRGWGRNEDRMGRRRPAFKPAGKKRAPFSGFVRAGSTNDGAGSTKGMKWPMDYRGQESRRGEKNEKTDEEEGKKTVKRKADHPPLEAEEPTKKLKQEDTGVFKVPTTRPPKSPKSPKSVNFTPIGTPGKEFSPPLPDGENKAEPMETIEGSIDSNTETKPKPDKITQEKTIFVKNLSYSVGENKLKEIFSKCGDIHEVRLVTNYQHKSKGFGYVEFKDPESVTKALTMDREAVEGRPMYVDRYIEKETKTSAKEFKYEMKLEKNKLFVSNLPRSATKDELSTLFSKYGTLKEVRIVTYRSGVPKGLAYVEFENEVDASKAIISTDGTDMAGHNIFVAISNPPGRKQPMSERKPSEGEAAFSNQPKSLGAKGVSGPRGKGRTQLSMVPRALKKTTAPAPSQTKEDTPEKEETGDPKTEVTKTKMSNADFAKMFLNK